MCGKLKTKTCVGLVRPQCRRWDLLLSVWDETKSFHYFPTPSQEFIYDFSDDWLIDWLTDWADWLSDWLISWCLCVTTFSEAMGAVRSQWEWTACESWGSWLPWQTAALRPPGEADGSWGDGSPVLLWVIRDPRIHFLIRTVSVVVVVVCPRLWRYVLWLNGAS